jgi:hypothetical protein
MELVNELLPLWRNRYSQDFSRVLSWEGQQPNQQLEIQEILLFWVKLSLALGQVYYPWYEVDIIAVNKNSCDFEPTEAIWDKT